MAEVASSRLMQVEDEEQQKSLGRLPPQESYEVGQESELRGSSSKEPKAWPVWTVAMRVKTSSTNHPSCTISAVILAMTVEDCTCVLSFSENIDEFGRSRVCWMWLQAGSSFKQG